ncbi:hypothetical protein [Almyronema epifaneia]|uniref:Peptidase S1 n=1 Tax=Almyronema epifaneia S1 TaxID=2991925 RepID=A0ABW6ID89_9CYAN
MRSKAVAVAIALPLSVVTFCWGLATTAKADYETFELSPNFMPNPVRGQGQSGGTVWRDDCGYVNTNDAPDHILELTADFSALRVSVVSPGDVTLFMRRQGTSETKCVDDSNGTLLPEFVGTWPAGRYHIWIGDWDGEFYPYEIYISHE